MQACQNGDNEIYFRTNSTVSHLPSPTLLSSHPTWARNHRVPFVKASFWCCDLLNKVVSTAVQTGESSSEAFQDSTKHQPRHNLFQEKRDCVTYRRRRRFLFKQEVKPTWQPRPLIRPQPNHNTCLKLNFKALIGMSPSVFVQWCLFNQLIDSRTILFRSIKRGP